MTTLETIFRLWEHAFWADEKLLEALEKSQESSAKALREFAHVLGAEEIWLARLEGRAYRAPVWPTGERATLGPLLRRTHAAYREYFKALDDAALERVVTYVNSAGQEFSNSVADILLHAALHGQYHRGKVNQYLRQAGQAPQPVDYIAFVRGAPAATEATALPKSRPS